jgi:hypothetical protein
VNDNFERLVADDLYELTRLLHTVGYEKSGGLLGGEFGYGAEVDNDVFEMHPYWWGDCLCGYSEAEWEFDKASHPTDSMWQEWYERHDHEPDCPTVRPNFRHKASGVEVRWYKYLGRSMEIKGLGSRKQWRRIITECEEAVA